jgi:CheY-like chemotaxis protein
VRADSSGPGLGSEFVIRLPIAKGGPRLLASEEEPLRDAGRRRILVIEDNRDVREPLEVLLRELGHDVSSAVDGAQGIDRALELRPDVALVDIGLPRFDGYEVARHVRAALGDAITLVALTGYGQPEDRRRALAAGFDSHLTKPVQLAALERALLERPVALPRPA